MTRTLDRKRFAGLIIVGGLIAFDLVGVVLGERRAQELPGMVSTAFSSLSPAGWVLSIAALLVVGLGVSWSSAALAQRATTSPRRTLPSPVALRPAPRDALDTLFLFDDDARAARNEPVTVRRHAA